ncbi:MAG: imidazole glycerol phosphate synthase subunit HisF [Acidimicrobiia bacterium]
MVLRKRVIPCLDVASGRVVKGVQFVDIVDAGDPVELAARYTAEGADEICFLDITATHEERPTLLDVVARTAAIVNIPLTVGGGVGSVEDMRAVLRAGADKVAVNSAAVARPTLLDECATAFGSQCVVLAIDARSNQEGSWSVWTHGGRTPTNIDAVSWAHEGARRGAGEILITSMDRDGTRAGYDIPLLVAVQDATNVPIVASGGAGDADSMVEALVDGKADAVLAASIFHRREASVSQVKDRLAAAGIAVREESVVTWP